MTTTRRKLADTFYDMHDRVIDAILLHPKRAVLFALGIGVLLGLMGCASVQTKTPAQQARAVTHKLTNEMNGGICSVVVLAPGAALTAGHCADTATDGKIVFDDGREFSVTVVGTVIPGKDQVALTVPGLPCPCAVKAASPAQQDEPVILVGYAFGRGQVLTRGEVQGRLAYNGETFIVTTVLGAKGMSGGGVFAVRDGEAYLIGIGSRMATPIMLVSEIE